MKAIVKFLPILLVILVSCSKKQGCKDINALNFDASAEKDGTCRYSKVIFYAPSNRVGGTADLVEKIEIYLGPTPGQELIGTITTFDHLEPSNCISPSGAFEFELPGSGVNYIFITKYFYEGDLSENGDTHLFKASSSEDCFTVRLTL